MASREDIESELKQIGIEKERLNEMKNKIQKVYDRMNEDMESDIRDFKELVSNGCLSQKEGMYYEDLKNQRQKDILNNDSELADHFREIDQEIEKRNELEEEAKRELKRLEDEEKEEEKK